MCDRPILQHVVQPFRWHILFSKRHATKDHWRQWKTLYNAYLWKHTYKIPFKNASFDQFIALIYLLKDKDWFIWTDVIRTFVLWIDVIHCVSDGRDEYLVANKSEIRLSVMSLWYYLIIFKFKNVTCMQQEVWSANLFEMQVKNFWPYLVGLNSA